MLRSLEFVLIRHIRYKATDTTVMRKEAYYTQIPRSRRHPWRATWVRQEAEGARGNVGMNLVVFSMKIKQVRQGEQP